MFVTKSSTAFSSPVLNVSLSLARQLCPTTRRWPDWLVLALFPSHCNAVPLHSWLPLLALTTPLG